MAWTDITWLFNEQPSSNKRNTEFQSVVHVREEANYYQLVNSVLVSVVDSLSSMSYQIKVDGSTLAGTSTVLSSTAGVQSDLDISGLTEDIHTVSFEHSSGFDFGVFRFYKTPDMERISFFYKFATPVLDGDWTHQLEYFTVIGHRELKSWT